MKRKYISLLIVLMMFTGCDSKSNNINESKDLDEQTFCVYYDRNVYEDGCIYHTDDGLNYYLDYSTLEVAPLCSIPNCDHQIASCVSRMVGSCPLLYGEFIYYFTSECGVDETSDGREFYINSKLMRIKTDSSELETVVEFHDAVPDTHDSFVVDDGILYFQADDMNPTEDDYGSIIYTEAGGNHFLCSIDLNTGKYTNYGSLYDGDKEYATAATSSSALIKGIYNNKIIIDYSFLKEEITDEMFEEEGFLMADQFTDVMLEFDLDEQKISVSDLPIISFIDNDVYAYYDKQKNSSIVVEGNSEKQINDVRISEYALILNNKLWGFFEDSIWYDLTDLSVHETSGYSEIIDYYNGHYIVRARGLKFKALTEDELLSSINK